VTPNKLTLKSVQVRPVVVPLKRPIVSKVGCFSDWPLNLIDLYTEEGIVGRSCLEPYLKQAARYLVPAILDLAEMLKGQVVAPFEFYRSGLGALHLVGREGMSMFAVSGLDMAAWDALAQAAGLPLAVFLGGTVGRVPAYNSNGLWLTAPDRLAAEAAELVAEGGFTLAALLEYRDHFLRLEPENKRLYPWGKLLADAATLPWAVTQIKEMARADPPFDYGRRSEHLLYGLIDRFAGELPADAGKAAYSYLRKQAPEGPTGNEAEKLWNVLFRLDARRAGREVLPSFATPSGARLRYNYRVVALLARHPGPSAEVAAAVRCWLATQADLTEFNRRQLGVVLLRADPDKKMGPAVRRIDQLLAEKKQKGERFEMGGEVTQLVLAMGDVESKAVEEPLARYVFDRSIETGVRFLILEALVKRRCGKSAALVGRWLAEESENMQRHCREEATRHWGAFGREVLEEAGRLRKDGKPD
jgi:Mandelate racemase / muconate lactonizing enzyme, N-terminal domain